MARPKKEQAKPQGATFFRYVGENAEMTAFGLVFRVNGNDATATTDDPLIIGKLRGNSHFEEVTLEG